MTWIHVHWLRLKWFVQGDWWETRFGQWFCERTGHAGPIWHNVAGNAPDMRCRRCYRDMG